MSEAILSVPVGRTQDKFLRLISRSHWTREYIHDVDMTDRVSVLGDECAPQLANGIVSLIFIHSSSSLLLEELPPDHSARYTKVRMVGLLVA